MKKILLLFLALLPLMASAYDAQLDGIYYNLDKNLKQATVTSGNKKYTGKVSIPATVKIYGTTYSVTAIGEFAFSGCSDLTSVTIPNSVTFIDDSAFGGCYGLTSIKIPDSVTSIEARAFYNCSGLKSITIPNSVTSIGQYAFYGCSGLTSVEIGNSVKYVRWCAFSSCTGMKDFYCYADIVPITESNAFDYSAAGLATLHVPEASVKMYQKSEPWDSFGDIVAISDDPVDEGITIDETNFPDGNFRRWVLSQDYGQDGVLTADEIDVVTSISVSQRNIQNLKGIEYFTALTTLECYNNLLTSLDVSNNTMLSYLRCEGNKLISLDVSKNTVLNTLLCGGNQLTALDVSNNTVLTRLDCNNPNLKTLNVSGCKALYELNVGGTQLTSLDLSGKTNLKILSCVSNQLKSLNVSGCTSLRDLSCNYNQLTTLNVSGCSGLKELYCSNNQLTALYVTGCVILRELQCQNNKIQGKAMDDFIASLPSTSGRMMYVINNYNEQNEMTTTQVAAAKVKGWTPKYMSSNGTWQDYAGSGPEPEGIAIDEKNFPDEKFRKWVLNSYGQDGVLTDDEIAKTDKISMPMEGIKSLKGIEYFTALGTLYFGDNQVTTLDVSKNTELTFLGCSNNQLTSLDVSNNTKLTYLSCDRNNLTSLDVSQNTALKTLYIYNNQIKGAEMDALVESLPTVSDGGMYVIYDTNEGNVMTTTQVAAAKAKGWMPKSMVNGRWQDYAGSEPEVKKCAMPVVAFYDGKLIFRCQTEDVEYMYQITTPVMSVHDGNNVTMPTKIQLTVYATKEGYEPSDAVTNEIDLSALVGKLGDVNGDGVVNGTDIQEVINIIVNAE